MVEAVVENSIKVQRALRNLTQAELAGLAGITRVSVNAIEGGRMTPSILLALKLAKALDVPVDELFRLRETGSNDQSASPVKPRVWR